MVTTARAAKNADRVRNASGKIVMTIRTIAYPPIPIMAGDNRALTGVGASACAYGSHMWTPNWAILTKKPKHIAATIISRSADGIGAGLIRAMSVTPPVK